MSRWKIQHTTITYAERELLTAGDTLEDTQLELTTTYGTDTLALVGRPAAAAVDNGNAYGELTLPVCRDYETIDAAMSALVELQTWADAHPLGELTISGYANVPPATWNAALRTLSLRITLAPNGYRVVATWSWALT